ncbi:hypothetical protein D1007_36592 [Hordeum vulgare]|nr:hypothetical protein D1007_36592 [Hordeum vulgare]
MPVTLLAPFCLIEDPATKTRNGSDFEVFSLTAWTAKPDGIPRSSELLLPPRDDVAIDADPDRVFRFVRPLIMFRISIHVSEVEDFHFPSPPPRHLLARAPTEMMMFLTRRRYLRNGPVAMSFLPMAPGMDRRGTLLEVAGAAVVLIASGRRLATGMAC